MSPEHRPAAPRNDRAQGLAASIEHALLRADATAREIEALCAEARQYGFHSVCVNGSRVLLACGLLADSVVKVVSTVGFPLGAADADAKRFETEAAIDNGAHEIDVVMNLGRFKDGDHVGVLRELRDVVEAADERPVKVIIETGLLHRDEKITACQLVLDSGAQFVKTSTGFNAGGATVEDVRLLRETVGARFGVKAAGGIRNLEMALALLEAGADRIGTSSGAAIMREVLEAKEK